MNPPHSKRKLKIPKGEKAINHLVEIEYLEEDNTTKWYRGKIIMYSRSKGYLIAFDGYGPDDNDWQKNLNSPDIRIID